ncbi:type II CAAX prenyl endopeptidase Rce1 family protein [Streptomyces sp. CBMA156]|uniref:CPBP family glutamic-type intramembrane protease n=1 Tax=Streptomyces sp. CBMA156 TaxID=1930280 RepID=UPI001661AC3E|nr:CPBP family glutamic-type intramembrane protease [Streptomyces sp. CBMA156]
MPFVQKLLGILPERTPLPRPRAGETGLAIAWSVAGPLAVAYMAIAIAAAWPGAQAAASGAATSGAGSTTADGSLLAASVWLGLSVPAWLMMWSAERAPAIGLPRMPPRHLLAATCAVFCLAEAPAFVASVVFELTRSHSNTLAAYSANGSGSTFLGDVATSAAAGISEEIVVLVLPALAAWRIGQALTGARQRRYGLLVLVVVLTGARLSYHLEHGLAAAPLVPWAIVSVLLYLRSRAVLPLMLAHAGYDVLLAVVNRITPAYGLAVSVTMFAVVTAVALVTALGLAPGTGQRVTAA